MFTVTIAYAISKADFHKREANFTRPIAARFNRYDGAPPWFVKEEMQEDDDEIRPSRRNFRRRRHGTLEFELIAANGHVPFG